MVMYKNYIDKKVQNSDSLHPRQYEKYVISVSILKLLCCQLSVGEVMV